MLPLSAQPIDNASPEAVLAFADQLYQSKDYYNALEQYEQYYKENNDAMVAYKLGDINEQLRDYSQAEYWFGQVVSSQSTTPAMQDILFKYAQMLKRNGKYDDARITFQAYLKETENEAMMEKAIREIEGCDLASQWDQLLGLRISNMGDKVNSKYSEYSPIRDGEDRMYFTAIRANKVIVMGYGNEESSYSKAYQAVKIDGKWESPQQLNSNINQPGYHTGNLALSEDGNTLYFTRVRLINSIPVESNLYYSKKINGLWGEASLAFGVNGNYLVRQPAVGEMYGEKVIIFAADIDRKGHSDLYYSTIKGNAFSAPRSLGEIINTDGDEEAPFFRDGTLYFSSNGHPGLGGFDIFSSSWNGNGFSEPTNMGKGYNSSVDDLYFSTNENKEQGFLVSNRAGTESIKSGTCCYDIWTFQELDIDDPLALLSPEEKEKLPGATVSLIKSTGRTSFLEIKPRNGASITLVNVSGINKNYKAVSLSSHISNDETYAIIVQKVGFEGDTLTIDGGVESSFQKELYLTLEKETEEYEVYSINEPIKLRNIFYDYDKWDVSDEAKKNLEILIDLMNKYPNMVIELSSHTDSRGEKAYNQNLSQRRADAVRDWIIRNRINKNRIKAVGYGESQILNQCIDGIECDEDGHRYNRRTEFKILKGPSTIRVEKKRLREKNGN